MSSGLNSIHSEMFIEFQYFQYQSTNSVSKLNNRDETIRSSHDTIRIDTKGDDMVIFDSIRYDTDNNCKNMNIHNIHILLFMKTTEECFD